MHYNFDKDNILFSRENNKEIGDIRLIINKFMLVFRIRKNRFSKDVVYWKDWNYGHDKKV